MAELKVREISLEKGRPKVAVPITAVTPAEIIGECEKIKSLPCEMLEWRADFYLSAIDNIDAWLENKEAYLDIIKILDDMDFIAEGKPIIFAVRSLWQGGRVQITKSQLESIYGIVVQSGLADFVDIELYDKEGVIHEDWIRQQTEEIHGYGGKVIISYHDFEAMPDEEEITQLVEITGELGGDICKIAAMASSEDEAEELLRVCGVLEEKGLGPMIMIAMGEHGKQTRVAGGKYGSVITFAFAGETVAPGQYDVHEMKERLDEYYGEE